MSKAANSPTSRLLRSSRLFSLPRPLPTPPLEKPSAQGLYRASDSATLPYPTHQAITTPASSNFRGDWGLKRPLPARSTRRTSTPVIRVYQQDTPEHITDFTSAADHALTERKWSEMGIPMTSKAAAISNMLGTVRPSAYEEWLDQTTASGTTQTASSVVEAAVRQRWKFDGPWIGGMHEDEFAAWLKKTLSDNKDNAEWLRFVAGRTADQRLAEEVRNAREAGEVITPDRIEPLKQLLRPTPSECREHLRKLREDHSTQGLASDLTVLICDYLDLPGVKVVGGQVSQSSRMMGSLAGETVKAPLSTHPAGGLSYIRTGAFMENHPVYGPQAFRSPVLARVLRTRAAGGRGRIARKAVLGVGGIVTVDPHASLPADIARRTQTVSEQDRHMTETLDPDLEGGNKIWVHPVEASMTQGGQVELRVTRGHAAAVAVKTGEPITDPGYSSSAQVASPRMPRLAARFDTPDRRRPRFTKGFDDELEQRRQDGGDPFAALTSINTERDSKQEQ